MKKKIISIFLICMMLVSSIGYLPVKVLAQGKAKTKEEKEIVVNVAFVVDSTGSMGPHIDNVKKNLKKFVDYLGSKTVDGKQIKLRMSLIDYQDITYDGKDSTIVHKKEHSVWFEKAEDMNQELLAIEVGDGGDLAETLLDGLGYVLDDDTMHFNSNAYKFSIIITDSNYKTDNRHGLKSLEEATEKLKEMNMYTSVITDLEFFVCQGIYEDITKTTGGILEDINGDFGDLLIKFADSIIKSIKEDDLPDTGVVSVTGVNIPKDQENITLKVGETIKIDAKVLPENATNKNIIWYSDQKEIAAVSSNGTITAKAVGATRVTVLTEDGGYTKTIEVMVEEEKDDSNKDEKDDFDIDDDFYVSSEEDDEYSEGILDLSRDKISLAIGNKYLLGYEVYPDQKVTFSSENPKIAKVTKGGTITAVKQGTTTIVGTAEDGTKTECLVEVLKKPTKVVLNKTNLIIGVDKQYTLNAAVAPADVSKKYKTLMWKTSNERVATVSKAGVIKTKKKGTCYISVNTLNGMKAVCKIVVK